MPLFLKKPIIIEAREWHGGNAATLLDWIGGEASQDGPSLIIPTREGDHEASLGDFIIKGIAGEFCPCKPDIFAATYEAVDENVQSFDPTAFVDFGDAVRALKAGLRVARSGWNGKGMWLRIFHPYSDKEFSIRENAGCDVDSGTLASWIGIHTADNLFVPWNASQIDVLSRDWMIVGDEKDTPQ